MDTIAVDIDGVLANFSHKLCYVFKKLYNKDLESVPIQSFDLRNVLCLDSLEDYKIMYNIFKDNDNFPPMPGAVDACNLLREHYNIIAVTARKSRHQLLTREWLIDNELSFIKPYFLENFQSVPDFDFLIDDSPKKIAILRHKTRKQAYLLQHEQNFGAKNILERYEPVKSWSHFVDQLYNYNYREVRQ